VIIVLILYLIIKKLSETYWAPGLWILLLLNAAKSVFFLLSWHSSRFS